MPLIPSFHDGDPEGAEITFTFGSFDAGDNYRYEGFVSPKQIRAVQNGADAEFHIGTMGADTPDTTIVIFEGVALQSLTPSITDAGGFSVTTTDPYGIA